MMKKLMLPMLAVTATMIFAGCSSSKDKGSDHTPHTHTYEVIQERHYYHPSYHHHRDGGTRVNTPDETEIRGPGVGVGVRLN